MIVTIVRNSQLRRPLRSVAEKDVVLVLPSGKILKPLKFETINSFCKTYIVAFDIPTENIVPERANFSGLEKSINDTFPKKRLRKTLEMLSLSQSLSIIHVAKELEIDKVEAKALVDMLVKWGAYLKYNTYWRRTPGFSVWIKKRVEG